jgi:hypothetical protein
MIPVRRVHGDPRSGRCAPELFTGAGTWVWQLGADCSAVYSACARKPVIRVSAPAAGSAGLMTIHAERSDLAPLRTPAEGGRRSNTSKSLLQQEFASPAAFERVQVSCALRGRQNQPHARSGPRRDRLVVSGTRSVRSRSSIPGIVAPGAGALSSGAKAAFTYVPGIGGQECIEGVENRPLQTPQRSPRDTCPQKERKYALLLST